MGDCYLVEGAKLKCLAGSRIGFLRLPNDHGCYDAAGSPLINIEDSKHPENIPRFGFCSITKSICTPSINGNWHTTSTNTTAGGASAVTTASCLVCSKGAFILPESSGQADPSALMELFLLMMMLGVRYGIFCGDPINVCTGNFVDQKTDLQISGAVPLVFNRTYNALDKRSGVMGKGWRHAFEVRLEDKKDSIDVTVEDGRLDSFHPSPSGLYMGKDGKTFVRRTTKRTYEMVTKSDNVYTFDPAGKCQEICDINGNQTMFHYKEDRLVAVENISGSFSFDYDHSGRLIAVTDSAGRTVQYTYDAYGTLGSVENVLGIRTEYKYDTADRLMTSIGSSGEPNFINSYDKKGRVEKQYFADGGVMQFEYDEHWIKTTVTEQNGNRVRYYQNEQLQNIKTVYYDGYEETDYNDRGLKTRFQDKMGMSPFMSMMPLGIWFERQTPWALQRHWSTTSRICRLR